MGLQDTLMRVGATFFLERPARSSTPVDLAGRMERDGAALYNRVRSLGDSPYHRKVLSHVIGIERWGQRRLKVFLGEPFVRDEYDAYRPTQDTGWDDLLNQFQIARAETIALARQLGSHPPASTQVEHNMFGGLTITGWLHYLNFHANAESKRMRPGN